MNGKDMGGRTLHIVLGAGPAALDRCLRCCAAGDTILFMDGGVGHLMTLESVDSIPGGVTTAYSGPDLRARGLEELARSRGVMVLDDSDLPALLLRNTHCLSWK